jgi:hypothetical protein
MSISAPIVQPAKGPNSLSRITPDLLKIELRRNTLLLLVPFMVALVWFSPLVRDLGNLALWPDRSAGMQNGLQGLGPFVAGVAAWMAGRERRRKMDDLLATTPRPPWLREITIWAATTLWSLLFYSLMAALVLVITWQQATWGGPYAGPFLVGLLALPAFSALGFTLGHFLPGRFTPALVAVGAFAIMGVGMKAALNGTNWAYLMPIYPNVSTNALWYGSTLDLAIVQALFLLGVTGLSLGSIGLDFHKPFQGRGRMAYTAASRPALVTGIIGLVLIAMSVALVSSSDTTAYQADLLGVRIPVFGSHGLLKDQLYSTDLYGVEIPSFGDTSQPAAMPYSPVCGTDPLPVCVHPAYQPDLSRISAQFNSLARPLLGLTGAPVRAEQRPPEPGKSDSGIITEGSEQVLVFPPFSIGDPNETLYAWEVAENLAGFDPSRSAPPEAAQQAQDAFALYLMDQAGISLPSIMSKLDANVTAAEKRFAALNPQARQDWLRAHYLQLVQGQVKLEDLP